MAVLSLLVCRWSAGCSQARKPVEEVDWGQPKPSIARTQRPVEPGPEAKSGKAASHPGAENGRSDRAPGSDKVGDTTGGNSGGAGNGNGSQPSSEPAEGGVVTESPSTEGTATDGAGKTPPPDEVGRPAPALPGRAPVKPMLSAAEASELANRQLKKAQQLLRSGDASAAAETAIQAYDQVLPHAKTDAECKKLCGLLESLINSTGRTRGRAEAVPTRFE